MKGLDVRSWFVRLFRLVVLLVLGGLTVLGPVARAQEATPVVSGEVVPPEECATEARPLTFYVEYFATPVIATPTAPIVSLPGGTEPDEQTRAEIIAVVRQLVACSNTGELLRALALYDAEYLRRTIAQSGQQSLQQAIEQITSLATPFAMPEVLLVRLVDIRDLRVLPDGRVIAVVITHSQVSGLETTLFFFARGDDGWFIEDAVSDWDLVETTG